MHPGPLLLDVVIQRPSMELCDGQLTIETKYENFLPRAEFCYLWILYLLKKQNKSKVSNVTLLRLFRFGNVSR